MNEIIEAKNAMIYPQIGSFLANYLGDRSCFLRDNPRMLEELEFDSIDKYKFLILFFCGRLWSSPQGEL